MTSFSVGICALNEEETIGDLLDQIVNEEVKLQEIIVVAGGTDSTVEIVEEKSGEYNEVELVEEPERQGQAEAQNEILSRATGEAIFLIDGDGTIENGSLEKMAEEYNGESIIHGREKAITSESFQGKMVSKLWEIHHEACLKEPKFTTQLGLIPGNLIEKFPEVVLDDTYVQLEAEEAGYSTIYLPEAVKYHNTPEDLKYYLLQREKNKSGIYQLEKMGYTIESRLALNLKSHFKVMLQDMPRVTPFIALILLEAVAAIYAQYRRITNSYPNKWSRPIQKS